MPTIARAPHPSHGRLLRARIRRGIPSARLPHSYATSRATHTSPSVHLWRSRSRTCWDRATLATHGRLHGAAAQEHPADERPSKIVAEAIVAQSGGSRTSTREAEQLKRLSVACATNPRAERRSIRRLPTLVTLTSSLPSPMHQRSFYSDGAPRSLPAARRYQARGLGWTTRPTEGPGPP